MGTHVVWLAALRFGGCIFGVFVRDRVLRRSPLDLSQSATAAAVYLRLGAGRVLHFVDVLRRRRNGRARGLGLPADLRRADAGVFAGAAVPGTAGRSRTG